MGLAGLGRFVTTTILLLIALICASEICRTEVASNLVSSAYNGEVDEDADYDEALEQAEDAADRIRDLNDCKLEAGFAVAGTVIALVLSLLMSGVTGFVSARIVPAIGGTVLGLWTLIVAMVTTIRGPFSPLAGVGLLGFYSIWGAAILCLMAAWDAVARRDDEKPSYSSHHTAGGAGDNTTPAAAAPAYPYAAQAGQTP